MNGRATLQEITASSNWEDSEPLFEESQEYRYFTFFFAFKMNNHLELLAGHLSFLSIKILRSFPPLGGFLLFTFTRSIAEESFRREIFEEYIAHLQEKAKERSANVRRRRYVNL